LATSRHEYGLFFCKFWTPLRGGPKKPKPKRVFDPKHPHVSAAKLIANRKK